VVDEAAPEGEEGEGAWAVDADGVGVKSRQSVDCAAQKGSRIRQHGPWLGLHDWATEGMGLHLAAGTWGVLLLRAWCIPVARMASARRCYQALTVTAFGYGRKKKSLRAGKEDKTRCSSSMASILPTKYLREQESHDLDVPVHQGSGQQTSK
jgi:hypothetical protein